MEILQVLVKEISGLSLNNATALNVVTTVLEDSYLTFSAKFQVQSCLIPLTSFQVPMAFQVKTLNHW